jgi:hypothetical protein
VEGYLVGMCSVRTGKGTVKPKLKPVHVMLLFTIAYGEKTAMEAVNDVWDRHKVYIKPSSSVWAIWHLSDLNLITKTTLNSRGRRRYKLTMRGGDVLTSLEAKG